MYECTYPESKPRRHSPHHLSKNPSVLLELILTQDRNIVIHVLLIACDYWCSDADLEGDYECTMIGF